ncbi:MAG: thermonuclease family protein [Myxococcota bacterium]|nr:thermonuclease family protein [Myxococcota bacterium]
MTSLRILFTFILAVVPLMGCDTGSSVPKESGPTGPVEFSDPVTVLQVIDGDTLEVMRDGEAFRVRMKGIDTPELYPDSGEPEPLAEEARSFVAGRLGLQVGLEYDDACGTVPGVTCLDDYGRTLAYVRLSNGDDLALLLLEAGLARLMVFGGDPFDRLTPYQEAETAAHIAGIGIWQ